jgi:hypothetical protein
LHSTYSTSTTAAVATNWVVTFVYDAHGDDNGTTTIKWWHHTTNLRAAMAVVAAVAAAKKTWYVPAACLRVCSRVFCVC